MTLEDMKYAPSSTPESERAECDNCGSTDLRPLVKSDQWYCRNCTTHQDRS